MTNTLKISMKPNEKIYINGAVIRVDRKVTVELLNDVQFLLQNHVIQAEDASTPLKQLYFIVQVMLMNPSDAAQAREMFRRSLPLLLVSFDDAEICATLKQVDRMVGEGKVFDALRAIRALYPLEQAILSATQASAPPLQTEDARRPLAVGAH